MTTNWLEPGVMLRVHRKKMALKQWQLAKAAGLKQHHISEMESGKRPITIFTAKRIGNVLKIDYRVFL